MGVGFSIPRPFVRSAVSITYAVFACVTAIGCDEVLSTAELNPN
jgi:hypothetical protein